MLWKEPEEKHEHDLTAWPKGRAASVWHFLCYPLRWAFKKTLVDVNFSDENRKKYMSVIGICVGYLAALSYIMIVCCDNLGAWMGASPVVMGLTLSAVGE